MILPSEVSSDISTGMSVVTPALADNVAHTSTVPPSSEIIPMVSMDTDTSVWRIEHEIHNTGPRQEARGEKRGPKVCQSGLPQN